MAGLLDFLLSPGITAASGASELRHLASFARLIPSTDLEEALPPATADTLGGALDTLAHARVVVRVVLRVKEGLGHGELRDQRHARRWNESGGSLGLPSAKRKE